MLMMQGAAMEAGIGIGVWVMRMNFASCFSSIQSLTLRFSAEIRSSPGGSA